LLKQAHGGKPLTYPLPTDGEKKKSPVSEVFEFYNKATTLHNTIETLQALTPGLESSPRTKRVIERLKNDTTIWDHIEAMNSLVREPKLPQVLHVCSIRDKFDAFKLCEKPSTNIGYRMHLIRYYFALDLTWYWLKTAVTLVVALFVTSG